MCFNIQPRAYFKQVSGLHCHQKKRVLKFGRANLKRPKDPTGVPKSGRSTYGCDGKGLEKTLVRSDSRSRAHIPRKTPPFGN